jgi:hypothetical protein
MNSLTDISSSEEYAEMFGFTQQELDKYFNGRLAKTAQKYGMEEKEFNDEVERYYSGYSFDGIAKVYNPYAIAHFLSEGEFYPYWVKSGEQEIVARYLNETSFDLQKLDGIEISSADVRMPGEISLTARPELFLYQTGYLTLRKVDATTYCLTYPNIEVRMAMSRLIVNNYFKSAKEASAALSEFKIEVRHSDYPSMINILNELVIRNCYQNNELYKVADTGQREAQHRKDLINFLYGAEFNVHGEVPTNKGIPDIVAEYNKKILVIEVKYVSQYDQDEKIVSDAAMISRCRAKLKEGVGQLYGRNYFGTSKQYMLMVIVFDESYDTYISHAVYEGVVYRISGKPADFTPIGDVVREESSWKIAWRDENATQIA